MDDRPACRGPDLDETGQEKKGQATVGVQRQHLDCASSCIKVESVPDPVRASAGEDTYPAFMSVAAELETRIGFLLARIGTPRTHQSILEV